MTFVIKGEMAEKGEGRREEIVAIMEVELPKLVETSPAFRHQLLGMMSEYFVKKEDLKQVLDAIKDLRADFNTRFGEHSRILEEHSRIIEEHSQTIKELVKRMDQHEKKLDIQEKRLESSIRGLGARWGLMSEESFREGLKDILQDIGLKVERYIDYDVEGYVFGHPDQVELDVVIKDTTVMIAEIKSSMSKGDVHAFQRKVEFYEKKQNVKVEKKASSPLSLTHGQDRSSNGLGLPFFPRAMMSKCSGCLTSCRQDGSKNVVLIGMQGYNKYNQKPTLRGMVEEDERNYTQSIEQ